MKVTATEFKTNMGKYLDLISTTTIYITKNGKEVARVSKPTHDRVSILNDLAGILPSDSEINEKKIKEERLSKQ